MVRYITHHAELKTVYLTAESVDYRDRVAFEAAARRVLLWMEYVGELPDLLDNPRRFIDMPVIAQAILDWGGVQVEIDRTMSPLEVVERYCRLKWIRPDIRIDPPSMSRLELLFD